METELTVSCKNQAHTGFLVIFFEFLRGVWGMPQRFPDSFSRYSSRAGLQVLESAGDISTLAGIQILNLAFLHQS